MAAIIETVTPKRKRRRKKRKRSAGPSIGIAKAKVLGGGDNDSGISSSNLLDLDDRLNKQFDNAGAIEPPLPPLVLVRLVTVSNCLRQNLDAMVSNVHGFGHTFKPIVDLESTDGRETVKTAMHIEREFQAEDEAGDGKVPDGVEPPDLQCR